MSSGPGGCAPERLAAKLRAKVLREFQPNDKIPSARLLAATFGVSVPTLRAAQAILMHDGLLVGYPRSGVRLAARPARLRVGVLSELNLLCATGGYYRDLAGHSVSVLRARRMAPVLYCGTVQPGEIDDAITCPEFWDAVERRQLDAAVILDVPGTEAWARRVRALPVPAVGSMTDYTLAPRGNSMIAEGLRCLQRQGARRIAMLTWNQPDACPRFEQALAGLGLMSRSGWIGGAFNPALPGSGWEAFREVWGAHAEKPDGLLVTDEVLFRDAALAIVQLGIDVPARLSVVTHANGRDAPPSALFPHTRFEFDPRADAEALTDLLERRMAGGAPLTELVRTAYAMVKVDGAQTAGRRRERTSSGCAAPAVLGIAVQGGLRTPCEGAKR